MLSQLGLREALPSRATDEEEPCTSAALTTEASGSEATQSTSTTALAGAPSEATADCGTSSTTGTCGSRSASGSNGSANKINAVSWLINSPAVLDHASESWVALTPQQAREIANVLHTAARFLRVFDGLSRDESDGTYALWRDADLFAAASGLREVLHK